MAFGGAAAYIAPMRYASFLVLLALSSPALAAPPPGDAWGPCLAGACEPDSLCLESKAGTVCAPECGTTDCTKVQVACGELVGDGTSTCLDDGLCVNECTSAVDCAPGQECSYDGACVWPTPEPSGAWAPCAGLCDGGFCIESAAGSVCLPPCAAEGCKVPTDSCGDDLPAECAQTGACELPCDADGGCWGAPMVCDAWLGFCVFPG